MECRQLHRYNKPVKRNIFFELIYILDGTGIQDVNKHRFHYRKGNLFLLTPQDLYSFNIGLPTTFFFLRFNESYIKDNISKDNEAVKQVEYILQNASHRPGCILKNKADKPFIASLVNSVLNEQTNRQTYFNRSSRE